MPLILALCFLFLCGHGHKHHVPAPASASTHAPVVHGIVCADIVDAYDGYRYSAASGYGTDIKQDDFVKRYPAAQQHRVLVCLDKLEKQGPQ